MWFELLNPFYLSVDCCIFHPKKRQNEATHLKKNKMHKRVERWFIRRQKTGSPAISLSRFVLFLGNTAVVLSVHELTISSTPMWWQYLSWLYRSELNCSKKED